MFDWALNIPLHMYKLSNNISFCCNTKQLQKGKHDTSFFTHTFESGANSFAGAGKYVFI